VEFVDWLLVVILRPSGMVQRSQAFYWSIQTEDNVDKYGRYEHDEVALSMSQIPNSRLLGKRRLTASNGSYLR
jgi:hypothetical protein